MKRMIPAILVLAASIGWSHRSGTAAQTPQAPSRVMSPPGTYYVLSYFATVTPRGVIGWTPGQEVSTDKQVMASCGSVAITDGAYSAVVPQVILTRDVETARSLRLADQVSQDQLQTVNAALFADSKMRERLAYIETAKSIERTNALLVASSTIGAFPNRLNLPAYTTGGGSYAGYYGDDYSHLPAPVSAAGNAGQASQATSGSVDNASTASATGLASGSGDLDAAVANARIEAARDHGLGLPSGMINRMATDAFHLDSLRDNQ